MNNTMHIPVMFGEAVDALHVQPNHWYVDATLGSGSHAGKILEQGGKVLGFDFDEEAVFRAKARFSQAIEKQDAVFVRENFDQLLMIVSDLKGEKRINTIYGILFDFGTSTEQLMAKERGLSFEHEDAQLDMRLDNRLGVKASDLLKVMGAKQLIQVFQEFGGERNARKIAKNIVAVREADPTQLETVGSLVKIINQHSARKGKLHPATKIFQALRIAVNDELNNIERTLPQALELVRPGGRIVTIAFHEGEDRLVKQTFAQWEAEGKGTRVNKKPLKPSAEEVTANPRSRSAKLRIFERRS